MSGLNSYGKSPKGIAFDEKAKEFLKDIILNIIAT